jgi:hypothetical protein
MGEGEVCKKGKGKQYKFEEIVAELIARKRRELECKSRMLDELLELV